MITATGLICGYDKKPLTAALDFTVTEGQIACLLGPNGVGKTTLIKTVLGLLPALAGKVTINSRPPHDYGAKEFAKTLAYVPQGHIPPFPFTVSEIVVMGRNPHMHELSSPTQADMEMAYRNLELLGIAHLAERDYTEVSGGERQLTLIARALSQESRILIMDEPTAHLDYGNATRVLAQVTRLAEAGYTIFMITHDPSHALLGADHVLAMGPNKWFQAGTPQEVLTEDTLAKLYRTPIELAKVQLRSGSHFPVCIPTALEKGNN